MNPNGVKWFDRLNKINPILVALTGMSAPITLSYKKL
jgi:hypothetical protein